MAETTQENAGDETGNTEDSATTATRDPMPDVIQGGGGDAGDDVDGNLLTEDDTDGDLTSEDEDEEEDDDLSEEDSDEEGGTQEGVAE